MHNFICTRSKSKTKQISWKGCGKNLCSAYIPCEDSLLRCQADASQLLGLDRQGEHTILNHCGETSQKPMCRNQKKSLRHLETKPPVEKSRVHQEEVHPERVDNWPPAKPSMKIPNHHNRKRAIAALYPRWAMKKDSGVLPWQMEITIADQTIWPVELLHDV